MPFYEYACKECEHEFEVMLSITRYDEPQACPKCDHQPAERVFRTAPGVVFKGDGWVDKDLRVKKQMYKRREKVGRREHEKKMDGGIPRLAPNVGGERVDSWSEAKKLAASKGKDTSSYEPLVRKEKSSK